LAAARLITSQKLVIGYVNERILDSDGRESALLVNERILDSDGHCPKDAYGQIEVSAEYSSRVWLELIGGIDGHVLHRSL
jgi:hypothetical protein